MPNLTEIEGLQIKVVSHEKDSYLRLIDQALSHAKLIVDSGNLNSRTREMAMAASAAIQSVNALLSAGSAKCYLSSPPEDIDVKQNKAGALIYRCFHDPAHEWDLNGHPLP
jgi:hypothetical protein